MRTWQDPIDVCVMRASCLRLTAKAAEVRGTQPIKLNNMLVNGNLILPFRMVLNSIVLLPAQVHSIENKHTVQTQLFNIYINRIEHVCMCS